MSDTEVILELGDDDSALSGSSEKLVEAFEPVEFEEISAAETDEIERSDAFKLLARPQLPPVEGENRAWLQIQTPTRLHFYWSLKNNPFEMLQKALPYAATDYSLILKLINLSNGKTTAHRADWSGNWWFDVDSDCEYRAEIGFASQSRPYFRVVFSNTVSAPRKKPSRRSADEALWSTPSNEFAQTLSAAGYKSDAFEVAMSGDYTEIGDSRARAAFSAVAEIAEEKLSGFDAGDLRHVLLAMASGATLESLRGQISGDLFQYLVSLGFSASSESALAALHQHFDIRIEEIEDEVVGSAVHGSSLVNFGAAPRRRMFTRVAAKPGNLGKSEDADDKKLPFAHSSDYSPLK